MDKNAYNYLIGFFSLIVLIIPFFGKLLDNRHKWYRRPTIRAYVLLVSFALAGFFSASKENYVELETNRVAEIARKADAMQSKRLTDSIRRSDDSVARERMAKSNLDIIKTFESFDQRRDLSETRNKQTIIDSLKNEIKKVKIKGAELVIGQITVEQRGDTVKFVTVFSSNHSAAIDVTVDDFLAAEVIGQYALELLPESTSKLIGVEIPMNSPREYTRELIITQKLRVVYFAYRIKYGTVKGDTTYLTKIYQYTFSDKRSGETLEPIRSNVLAFFKKSGISLK